MLDWTSGLERWTHLVHYTIILNFYAAPPWPVVVDQGAL